MSVMRYPRITNGFASMTGTSRLSASPTMHKSARRSGHGRAAGCRQGRDQGAEVVVVRSVKAASEVEAPVSGSIVEINEALASAPGKANEDPTGEGWFFKIKMSDPAELETLMDEAAYNELVED